MADSVFLTNFVTAVREYPKDSVTLQITNREAVLPDTGPSVNTGEVWNFRVLVRNTGHLNMTGVALQITGRNGTKVKTSTSDWTTTISAFGNLKVDAHDSVRTGEALLSFMAPPGVQPAGTELVCVQIARFDVNLNHILIDHSGSSALPRECYKDQVFPS